MFNANIIVLDYLTNTYLCFKTNYAGIVLLLWEMFYIEWFFLQTVFIYSFVRLILEKNHLKQVLIFMCLLVIMCIYLSLMQYELFACFLFLGEFTIAIFFYCLFLHLNTDRDFTKVNKNNNKMHITILLIAFGTVFFFNFLNNLKLLNINEISLIWDDLYSRSNNFSLNDLSFISYYFTSHNKMLFWFIAVLLCVLTLTILYSVYIYNLSKLSKKEWYNNSQYKIATKKYYFEQTPLNSQKIIAKK